MYGNKERIFIDPDNIINLLNNTLINEVKEMFECLICNGLIKDKNDGKVCLACENCYTCLFCHVEYIKKNKNCMACKK